MEGTILTILILTILTILMVLAALVMLVLTWKLNFGTTGERGVELIPPLMDHCGLVHRHRKQGLLGVLRRQARAAEE
jgi:hypothetical protein